MNQRWWAWVGTIAAGWLGLYVHFWYQRSGCIAHFDRACLDAPVPWLERLVSFWWVRDYQELVAAIIALSAAYVVSRPVYIQLREARRQSSAAAIPHLRSVADEVERHQRAIATGIRKVRRIGPVLEGYDREGNSHRLFEEWVPEASGVLADLNDLIDELQRAVERAYAIDRDLELHGLDVSNRLNNQFRLMLTAFLHSTSGPDLEDGEEDLSEALTPTRNALRPVVNEWGRWGAEYNRAARDRVSQVWAKIRQLEDEAMGGRL